MVDMFAVIQFLVLGSIQNFAHATTVQLSWRKQNFVVIILLGFRQEENIYSIHFLIMIEKSSLTYIHPRA